MKQSALMSLIETVLGTAIGFGIALATQIIVFPWFGFNPTMSQNLSITIIFTVVSIARGFLLRRLFEALHIRRPMSPAMNAVIAERYRQIEIEGWSTDHDDKHDQGELAQAGACYALFPGSRSHKSPPTNWPWLHDWWKPQDFRRDLVRAGALILAEIERFDRGRKRHARARQTVVTDDERRYRCAPIESENFLSSSLAHNKDRSTHSGSSE